MIRLLKDLSMLVTNRSDACVPWPGYIRRDGYGKVMIKQKSKQAHRFIYETLMGKVPNGLVLDHLCRNRSCVNPFHLEVVTCRENILRGISPAANHARKTHCLNGHAFSGENMYYDSGRRACRICTRARLNARRAKSRAIT